MKVIDLMNKIANGEEVPKKIEFISDIYELSEDNCYISNGGNFLTDSINFDLSNLNDEIKLIEDEQIDTDNIKEEINCIRSMLVDSKDFIFERLNNIEIALNKKIKEKE